MKVYCNTDKEVESRSADTSSKPEVHEETRDTSKIHGKLGGNHDDGHRDHELIGIEPNNKQSRT